MLKVSLNKVPTMASNQQSENSAPKNVNDIEIEKEDFNEDENENDIN